MQNDQGECVDMYIPRKCSASNRIIHARDHASIGIAFAELDEQGHATGSSKNVNICGEIRRMGESDDSINRLTRELGLSKNL